MKQQSASLFERVVYHEAGHAVLACLHHRPFTSVSIVSNTESYGRCSLPPLPNFYPECDTSRRMERLIEREIVITLAGMVVEQQLCGQKPHRWRQQPDYEGATVLA